MGWFQRADYRWLLLADPPICRGGRPEVVLNNCDRLRRGEVCWCRFETQEAVEDVALIGAPGALDDWLTAGDLDDRRRRGPSRRDPAHRSSAPDGERVADRCRRCAAERLEALAVGSTAWSIADRA